MLRDYQIGPVEEIKTLLSQCTSAVLVAPTGAGKTVMAADVVSDAVGRGEHVLFLARRRELLAQARRAVEEHELEDHNQLTIMSIQRAKRNGPDHVDLLVIDEAHRAAAKTYKAVMACAL